VAGVTAAFRAWGHDVAAVIVEPCATNMGVVRPVPGFLAALREACDAAGALLVFDEVVSGFRFRYGGLGPEVGVEPDLVTFGKIIGGGTPIGAFGGRAHHLEVLRRAGGVFQGGTFAGNPLSMAAGLATLDELAKPGFYEGMERRGCVTEATLLHGFQKHGLPFFVQRKGSLLSLILIEGQKRLGNLDDVQKQDGKLFARFHLRMLEAGFLLPPTIEEPLFISAAHTEDDLVRFATAAARVLADLAAGRP
ncbi:MAG TPA: aminotransferase class III-fold pyridoxal phosphate-dependent enzyme, partial [Methylomirabilota bacterium]|nr:aminotransferase class III-fold pyridoxal phosphate-dependent enzyme [Methylomirabilota bacterium]